MVGEGSDRTNSDMRHSKPSAEESRIRPPGKWGGCFKGKNCPQRWGLGAESSGVFVEEAMAPGGLEAG